MGLSDSQFGQLMREATRAGEIDFSTTMSALQVIQSKTEKTKETKVKQSNNLIIASYELEIDYNLSLKEVIENNYREGQFAANITDENFPTQDSGKKTLTFKLIHQDIGMSSEDIIAYINSKNLRPANALENVQFGIKYPDLQKEFIIFALGQIWKGFTDNYYAVALTHVDMERCLDLRWIRFVSYSNSHCSLAVSK
jgi:hypothetical protein